MVAQLLQRTAVRYQVAVSTVLETWTPNCDCHRPGCRPCPQCPLLHQFEALVRDEIQRLSLSDSVRIVGSLHDSGRSLSQPPL